MRRLASLLVARLAVSVLSPPARAGINIWTGGGPAGGPIRALLVDSASPTTIYAGTLGSGVFKSVDGGFTWNQTEPAGLLGSRTVRALVQDGAGTLYAGVEDAVDTPSPGGVFRSVDGGATWTPMDSGLTDRKVQALGFD